MWCHRHAGAAWSPLQPQDQGGSPGTLAGLAQGVTRHGKGRQAWPGHYDLKQPIEVALGIVFAVRGLLPLGHVEVAVVLPHLHAMWHWAGGGATRV